MASNLSRPLNPHIKLVPFASTETFETLLGELKQWRKNNGKRGWGKLEPEVLRVIKLITLDLFAAWLSSSELLVGYSRNAKEFTKSGRYWDDKSGQKLFTEKVFLSVIDGLAALNFLDDKRAKQGTIGQSSRIKATQMLIDVMKDNGITWAALDASPDPSSLIELKSKKDKQGNKTKLPYDDSVDARIPEMREALVRINERLQGTLINLNVTDDELKAINRRLANDKDREMIDFTKRYLVRKFTDNSFDSGGRYYGGWFQQVPKEYRTGIIINDTLTVEWDFKTLHPTILYLKSGLTPPEDSYDLTGWDKKHRDLYKKVFNQVLNSSPGTRKKTQWYKLAPDLLKKPLPPGWDDLSRAKKSKLNREEFLRLTGRDYDELIEAIILKHRPIEHHLFSKAWSWLQKLDSDIAEKVMLDMLENKNEVILPLHDSFIIMMGSEKYLYSSMQKAFRELLGKDPIIDANLAPLRDGDVKSQVASVMEQIKNYQKTHSGFNQRNTEWVQVWGLNGRD
ncbi:MAG TPA: hypothetical protein EYO71_11510 [Rhodospirillales bacterium]|nr:hypothetical protein [Rhodospirillales bacterium]